MSNPETSAPNTSEAAQEKPPLSHLIFTYDPSKGALGFHQDGPIPPAMLVNVLEIAKSIYVDAQKEELLMRVGPQLQRRVVMPDGTLPKPSGA